MLGSSEKTTVLASTRPRGQQRNSALKSDIHETVDEILREPWTTRSGQVVPAPADVGLGNHAVLLEATALYADLSGSTDMVDTYKPHFSAEIYKTYLHSTAKVIRSEGGEIVAYDGDRVMAIFIGDSKNTSAVRCGLKISYAAQKVVSPAVQEHYPGTTFKLRQVVGIDTSRLWAARALLR